MEELIKKIRELHQMMIFTVDENWCIHLFELHVAANDYDVEPCAEFSCIYENSSTNLNEVLQDALKWAVDRIRQSN